MGILPFRKEEDLSAIVIRRFVRFLIISAITGSGRKRVLLVAQNSGCRETGSENQL